MSGVMLVCACPVPESAGVSPLESRVLPKLVLPLVLLLVFAGPLLPMVLPEVVPPAAVLTVGPVLVGPVAGGGGA
ncbi:hypothetical protein ACFPCZ_25080 [Streptomonospora arabica]|uniref:Secreted protein n=1 Tax=Streptomonospora arabica TaxID=412417 RepID=A0ABV9SUB0_9ACTN